MLDCMDDILALQEAGTSYSGFLEIITCFATTINRSDNNRMQEIKCATFVVTYLLVSV